MCIRAGFWKMAKTTFVRQRAIEETSSTICVSTKRSNLKEHFYYYYYCYCISRKQTSCPHYFICLDTANTYYLEPSAGQHKPTIINVKYQQSTYKPSAADTPTRACKFVLKHITDSTCV